MRRVLRLLVCLGVLGSVAATSDRALGFVEGPSDNFFGDGAGANDSAAEEDGNSFFGANAGNATTTGGSNSFFGANAGEVNSTEHSNSFFGRAAGLDSVTCCNSYFGAFAGRFIVQGSKNAVFGAHAALTQFSGSSNAFFGERAGGLRSAYESMTLIGADSDAESGLTNATALGRQAYVEDSNSVVVGSIAGVNDATASVNVGIGTATPDRTLDVHRSGALAARFKNNTAEPTADRTVLVDLENANTVPVQWRMGVGGASNFFGLNDGQFYIQDPTNLALVLDPTNSFFGKLAGAQSVPATNNSFFGAQAGRNTISSENAFFGFEAGRTNTTGGTNAFFGNAAGRDNTTGGANAFFGNFAGEANTTGGANSFFGAGAGEKNTAGINNSFFGRFAGFNNTVANGNSFFGRSAGTNTTSGAGNAFFGMEAGVANTVGAANAFFGQSAGADTTTGGANTFLGAGAGENNIDGVSNAAVGRFAGFNNTEGDQNVFMGREAGLANTMGNDNTFLGSFSNGAPTITNATAVGHRAQVSQANSLVLGSIAGVNGAAAGTNVGIGITTPQDALHIEDFFPLRFSDGEGDSFRFNIGPDGLWHIDKHGNEVFKLNHTAEQNALVVDGAGIGVGTDQPTTTVHVRRTDGTAKIAVQEASATALGRTLFQLTNNGAARFRVENTSNNAVWDFQSSGGGGSFVIDKVGGPASLDFEMQPDGDLAVRGSVSGTSFISTSDRNAKTDITPANAAKLMSLLKQLDISTWRFKDEPKGTINLGPMAQDFHRLFGMGTDTTIDVRDLAALALVAAQVFDAENSNLESRVERLEVLVEG